MKITKSELRNIIKEEIQKSNKNRAIKEAFLIALENKYSIKKVDIQNKDTVILYYSVKKLKTAAIKEYYKYKDEILNTNIDQIIEMIKSGVNKYNFLMFFLDMARKFKIYVNLNVDSLKKDPEFKIINNSIFSVSATYNDKII